MKHLLLGLALLFVGSISAQSIQAENVNIQMPETQPAFNGMNDLTKSQSCGPDTIQYSLAKATGLTSLDVNNATSASAIAQYFDAPQELTISGVTFYAYKIDVTGGITMNCNVEIYAAGADSLPSGVPLATTTVAIDTSFGGGSLDTLRKHATLASPIIVNNPYVVVVSNPSATSMGVIFNDYNALPADGAQEWLVSASIFGNWLRSYDVNVGGVPFDADGLFEPHVSYDLTASFLNDNPCLDPGLAVNFTNQSSSINFNRMYNQAEYLSLTELSFTWNYGDASPAENLIDATHTYASVASYAVTLTDTVYGWTTNCIADTTVTIGPGTAPVVAFTSVESGLTSNFTNGSTAGPDATYTWDFGDGNTSTTMNPSHTYATAGTYTVCLSIADSCVTELSCQSVTVTSCTTPVAGFTVAGTSPTFDFTNTSTTTGTVTYSWDFGDGNTSTVMNPTHTYTADGTYNVCLDIADDCGTVSYCENVTVTICATPVAGFTVSGTSPTFDFTNTSTTTGTVTYSWDFGDGNTSTQMNPSHNYAADGIYNVCLDISDDCGTVSYCENVTVTICATPVAGFAAAGTSPTFNFTNTSTTTGTVTYSWDFGDGNTSTVMDPTHTYTSNGTYNVCLDISDDCGTVSYCENVTVNTLGIDELSLTDIVVYPNPSKGIFSIKANNDMKNSIVTDITGKVVFSKSLSGNEAIINTGDLANGAYFLSIRFTDGSSHKVRLEIVK